MINLISLCGLLVLQAPTPTVQEAKPVDQDGKRFDAPVTQFRVLKAMQSEVTAIVRRVRGAVVTIQDIRPSTQSNNLFGGFGAAAAREADRVGAQPTSPFGGIGNAQNGGGGGTVGSATAPGPTPVNPLRDGERWELDAAGNRVILAPDGQVRALYETPANPDALEYRLVQVQNALKGRPTPEDATRPKDQLQKEAQILHDRLQNARPAPQQGNQSFGYYANTVVRSGTGFCVGGGYIVTTADVLEGMTNPVVIANDGRQLTASVAGIDNEANVGLLRLSDDAKLPALTLGNSQEVEPGQFAIAVGNQNGQNNSVSLSMVAGLTHAGVSDGRRSYSRLIEIAGTIGAGSSGAPLVNVDGEVIGIIAAIQATQTLSFQNEFIPGTAYQLGLYPRGEDLSVAGQAPGQNLPAPNGVAGNWSGMRQFVVKPAVSSAGFAIPITDVQPVLGALQSGKQIQRVWLGVATGEETRPGDGTPQRLVRIREVYPETPAARAGILPGDVLISLNGRQISSMEDMGAVLLNAKPGDVLSFVVQRQDGSYYKGGMSVQLRPANKSNKTVAPPTATPPVAVPVAPLSR